MKFETREQWLKAAGAILLTDYIAPHASIDGVQWSVSCGWPSTRALSAKNRRLGECWHADACSDKKTNHIFVTPAIHGPLRVLDTLLHELIHAVVGQDAGHKGPFKRVALAVGLEPPMTCTIPSQALEQRLTALAGQLGLYPHAAITADRTHKVQSTRLIKVVAVKCCQYTARTTRTWLEEQGNLRCPHNSPLVEVS